MVETADKKEAWRHWQQRASDAAQVVLDQALERLAEEPDHPGFRWARGVQREGRPPELYAPESGEWEALLQVGGDLQQVVGEWRVPELVGLAGFLMAKYQTTQVEWESVMKNNPSYFKGEPRRPVEHVSWLDAIRFCNRLSELEGLKRCYTVGNGVVTWDATAPGYRLPTEAEWEYAAKAGGNFEYAGSNDVDEVAWYVKNSGDTTHPVGLKKPNAWGLYDMSGNVWERCWDAYGQPLWGKPEAHVDRRVDTVDRRVDTVERFVDTSLLYVDTKNKDSSSRRVDRGGSYWNGPRFLRSSVRNGFKAEYEVRNLGFRCIRSPGPA
jgi:formylglycine-generating enzyme required for sulfatase activity